MRAFLLTVLSFFMVSEARAYIPYNVNANLEEELEAQPYRVLPHTKNFFLAVDADFFKPVFVTSGNATYYKYDFYHGNGVWLDLRSEFKANDDLVVDFKGDITHGTSSNGPSYGAIIVPHVGLTYRLHNFLGLEWESRLSDINRQTIGNGLFIEDKETEGGYVTAKGGDFAAKLMVDGTGSYQVDGGVVALDANLWSGLLGVTVMLNETATDIHPPQFVETIYSRKSWKNGLGYAAEIGGDATAMAALAYVKFERGFDHLHLLAKPQFRSYGHGVLGSLPGHIENNYVSYDQNDKPFTNLMDIFAFGDHVETYSAMVNAEFAFNILYHVYAETEYVNFVYHDRYPYRALFFRTGFRFFPFKDRQEQIGFLVGNKYLIASTAPNEAQGFRTTTAPNATDTENKPLFMRQMYFMFNFSTHL